MKINKDIENKILNLIMLSGGSVDAKQRQKALHDLVKLMDSNLDDYKNAIRNNQHIVTTYGMQLCKYFNTEKITLAYIHDDVKFLLDNYPDCGYHRYFVKRSIKREVKTELFGFFPEAVTMTHSIEYYTLVNI